MKLLKVLGRHQILMLALHKQISQGKAAEKLGLPLSHTKLLKAVAMPEEFAIFTQFGRIISHARRVLLRIATGAWLTLIGPAYHRVLALSRVTEASVHPVSCLPGDEPTGGSCPVFH